MMNTTTTTKFVDFWYAQCYCDPIVL